MYVHMHVYSINDNYAKLHSCMPHSHQDLFQNNDEEGPGMTIKV